VITGVGEGPRRLVGTALPITALLFLAYGYFWIDLRPAEILDQMYLTTEGLFGIPLAVSATFMVLFIMFGALVERTGTGKLFMDFALALTGSAAGGPAKVAVMTSAMFGTISGSSTANVMTTGTFTIPLMKRIGYKPAFAGAIEAVASTGGQIMPPIMGAAAFIMAEFLGISYVQVTIFALVPALLYYLAVFLSLHFEARRAGMQGLPRAELPRLLRVLGERGHLFLPLVIIVGILLAGYSAPFAALCGIASAVPAALLRRSTRAHVRLDTIVDALEAGARNTVAVALSCASAGIVIGVIFLTGLGLEFTNLVLAAAASHMLLALLLTMIAGIILGMGMPTAPAYIMQTALLVPALVRLGVPLESAHLFVFYFAILSAITLSCNIHTGRIGAISDQFALGTPWDEVRRTASQLAIQFRHAHGVKQPATLHEDELEYQEGWKERRARLERRFEVKPPLTFTSNGANGHGNGHGASSQTAASGTRAAGRPEDID
jgi:TRAP transporter 4TM/12TM fusion protein